MVRIGNSDIIPKLRSYYPSKRMPLLCSVNRSFGRKIISEVNEEYDKEIRSEVFDFNKNGNVNENYLTSMTLSEDGIIAIGSGNKSGSLYFIRDKSAVKDIHSGVRFKPLHNESVNEPIYSLDWSGDYLLIGTRNGITKLYSVKFDNDHIQEFKLMGEYSNSPSEIQTFSPSYISNTHVRSAEFMSRNIDNISSSESYFLSTTYNQLSVWDVSRTDSPVYKLQPDESPLLCASWSPNQPESLIVTGGYGRNLSIADTRMKNSIVWNAPNAHDRPICDAKFNSFIPYWLASAGEDSIINIWDIRSSYNVPIGKIDGHIGTVTSIAWSNIRPENLGSTSSDGMMHYWSLCPENFPIWDTLYKTSNYCKHDTLPVVRKDNSIWYAHDTSHLELKSWTDIWDEEEESTPKPKYTIQLVGPVGLGSWGDSERGFIYNGEEVVESKGSMVLVKASKTRPATYYSISGGGQLVGHTIRFDAISNLRNRHRFDPENKNEISASIEDDIYCRRITKARQKLEKLKNEKTENAQEESYRQEDVEFFEDCLKIREPIKEKDWSFNSIPDMSNKRMSRRLWNADDILEHAVSVFKRDLKYWSYRIPPGYNTRYKFPLEFKEPTIPAHLVEKKKIIKSLPPLVENTNGNKFIYTGDVSPPIPYDGEEPSKKSISVSIDNPNSAGSFGLPRKNSTDISPIHDNPIDVQTENIDQLNTSSSKSLPIKERRNISDIPPIITMQNANDIAKNPFELAPSLPKDKALTTADTNPFENSNKSSALSGYSLNPVSSRSTMASKNPFEIASDDEKDSMTTNPFDPSYQELNKSCQSSKNPFEPLDVNNDIKSVKSLNLVDDSKSERHHRLSRHLSLSRSFGKSSELEEKRGESGSKPSKSHHRFNVFKKLPKTRNNSDNQKQKQSKQKNQEQLDNEDKPLSRQGSLRRNALHGNF